MSLNRKGLSQGAWINSQVDNTGQAKKWTVSQARKSFSGEKTVSQAWSLFMPRNGQRFPTSVLPHGNTEWNIHDQEEMLEYGLRRTKTLKPRVYVEYDGNTGKPIIGPKVGADGRIIYPNLQGQFVQIPKEPVEQLIEEATQRQEELRELTKRVINMDSNMLSHILGYDTSVYHKSGVWPPGLETRLPDNILGNAAIVDADARLESIRIESNESKGRASFLKLLTILSFTWPEMVSTQISVDRFGRETEVARNALENARGTGSVVSSGTGIGTIEKNPFTA